MKFKFATFICILGVAFLQYMVKAHHNNNTNGACLNQFIQNASADDETTCYYGGTFVSGHKVKVSQYICYCAGNIHYPQGCEAGSSGYTELIC